jgi:polyhydroxyalkanoate synthase subunit PhaC
MPFDQTMLPVNDQEPVALGTCAATDQFVHGEIAKLTGGRSPLAAMEAWTNWLAHLALSPGKQAELWRQAYAGLLQMGGRSGSEGAAASPAGSRFAGEAWSSWPYSMFATAHRASETWWRSATTGVRGVSGRHEQVIEASVCQVFHALSPANFLLTNPELQRATRERGGGNLLEGARHFVADASGAKRPVSDAFVVGKTLAITPGKVIFRNRLIELIQYAPATASVYAEPVLIVPAWIMKYYILDLRPQNSMIRFLVEQGHTVFAMSWRNPTAEDRDLTMDDYRRLGVMAALDAVDECLPKRRVHAAGYCLGGTLLAIAAAAMARDGDSRLASVTLFTAQTDFTEPGDLKLFIDDSELVWLDSLMSRSGGLTGDQMGAAFQMLRAEEMIWVPFVQRYLLGETDHPNDLMAWNADQTRMPGRMHTEYLRSLFLNNALARGQFPVAGRPIALRDIRVPIFALGTAKDHVAPWRSAYKITLLARADVTFVLASGGHNAGVVSEPGHKGRSYRVLTMPEDGPTVDPDTYLGCAALHEGSWWPEWQRWLAEHSAKRVAPPEMAQALCDAPGTYVFAD